MLDLDLILNVRAWPKIESNVAVTPALARRFVPRNWQFGYNGHSIYQLGADLYAVTRSAGVITITARIRNADRFDVQDMIAFLSEWEG